MDSIPFIPFFTTSRYRVEAMVELAQIKPGEKVADLGSGDGRIALAFAKKGAYVIGFEMNTELLDKSQKLITAAGLSEKITILHQDFWDADFSLFDVIAIYPMPDVMDVLEEKLEKEAKPEARIITNYYPLPTWKIERTKDHIYLYKK